LLGLTACTALTDRHANRCAACDCNHGTDGGSYRETPPVPPPTDELTLLRANPWQWELFGEEKIEQPANYRLTFNTDASLVLERIATRSPVRIKVRAANSVLS